MARTARLRKSAETPTPRVAPRVGRRTAYHGDVTGHQKILAALGAVPELNDAMPRLDGTVAGQSEARWPAIKTFFFVMVFCSTAWATISAAIVMAFR